MSTIEPWLREILRCPACRSELADGTGPDGGVELVCTNTTSADCALAFRVDDGVPVLLVDEARPTRG
ncbi:MAG TPA: Trm112 family protein [Actinomycetales bacterium]|nr:Trm112 family protein [Actinomycetales bacterium]